MEMFKVIHPGFRN